MYKTIFLLFGLFLPIIIEAEPFTILARSGLNVRKEPNVKSEKVRALPYGTIVDAGKRHHLKASNQVEEVIEGKKGMWIKITSGNVEGYIFSGFGLYGEWVTKGNPDFGLLTVGHRCTPVK
jgi:hypothetical protein